MQVFFLADIFGSPVFSFNTTAPVVWFPAANGTSTEFTLDITDNQDGTYAYNVYVTGGCTACRRVTPGRMGLYAQAHDWCRLACTHVRLQLNTHMSHSTAIARQLPAGTHFSNRCQPACCPPPLPADDLAAAAVAVKLHFRNGSANYPAVLTLPANFTEANSGGYADGKSLTAAGLPAQLRGLQSNRPTLHALCSGA